MAEQSILTFDGVHCYLKADGTAYLKLEDVARGLGFTTVATSGNEVIRWSRVRKYLQELNAPACGDTDYIPEQVFYMLAMKANNEAAKEFQRKIAYEIIPEIRKTGHYSNKENSKRVYKAVYNFLYEHYDISEYADIPKVKYNEALSLIENWYPSYDLQLSIDLSNNCKQQEMDLDSNN